jgi:hypothetical protein
MPYKDPQKRKEYQKNYAKTYVPEHRDRINERARILRVKNPEKYREIYRRYDVDHPEHASWDRMKKWREENREHFLETRRIKAKREYNKEERRLYMQSWKKKNPDKVKNSTLKSEYGITLDEFNLKLQKQEGRCSLCFKELDSKTKGTKPQVDHDHVTGATRDLLCMRCNTVLGLVDDNIQFLNRFIEYIEKHSQVIPSPGVWAKDEVA